MGNDSGIDLFLDLFWTLRLKNRLTYLSLCVKYPLEDKTRFLKSLRELASEVKFDQKKFYNLLDCYVNTVVEDDLSRIDDFVNSYYDKIQNEIISVPNNINKAYDSLRGLIGSKYFVDHLQAYDAMVLLKDEISHDLIKEIIVEWKQDKQSYDSDHLGNFSSIFWVSYDFMEFIDSISMYRFKETFDIKGFDSTFKEVKKELESVLWEHLPPETLDSGPFYFWLIDRIPDFIDEYYGTTPFLESITNEQNELGYWYNKGLIKSKIVDEDTGIIKWTEYEKDTSGTALCSINLIKHSTYGSLRDSGIKGVKWLLEQQNPDGSWSDEIRSRSSGKIENKKSLFATLLALEALIRSEIPNLTSQIELAFEWIMSKQNKWGWWEDDEFQPLFQYSTYPLMTVLVLELENLMQSYKEKQLNPEAGDLMVNTIPNYELLDPIGSGGFGNIFKCKRSDDGSLFAIKKLVKADAESIKRFQHEVQIQLLFDHKNIVPVIDYNLEKSPHFYIMPLAISDLDYYLDNSYENVGENSLWIFFEIAEGIKYTHENKKIHRDLKPGNILLFEDDDENIYSAISDFGLVKAPELTRITSLNAFKGTEEYMAPEQRNNARTVDETADIYSLGKILYKILTGETPYVVDYTKVRDFEFVMRKACSLLPADRYNNVNLMISDVKSVLDTSSRVAMSTEPNIINKEIESILEDNDFSNERIENFARLLRSKISDNEFLLNFLPQLPDSILQHLVVNHVNTFIPLINRYDSILDDTFIPFEYCDDVANFYLKIFYIADNYELRDTIIKRLPKLAHDNGRYYVADVFASIVSSLDNSSLILRVKDILKEDCSMTVWLNDYLKKYSMDYEIQVVIDNCMKNKNVL